MCTHYSTMEKLLTFVLLVSFAFCQPNGDDCVGYNETVVNNQHLIYTRHSHKCQYTVEIDRLKFVHCTDRHIDCMAAIIAQATNVRTIDISHSKLHSIIKIDLQHNPYLKKFIAAHNRLRVFPKKCLSTSSTIEEIDLSSNLIKHIGMNAFNGISTVKIVNLSSNAIAEINKDAFVTLEQLEIVDLRRNQIIKLERIRFCFGCVVSLHLEHNPFDELTTDSFQIENNISMFVSWAHIRNLDLRKHLGRFRVSLDPNQNHEGIVAKCGVSQHDIRCGEESFEDIESLAVGPNQIENLSILLKCISSTIQKLILSGNFLGIFDRHTFERFTNLQYMFVANTQLLYFDFSILSAMQIHRLDISLNWISNVRNVFVLQRFESMTSFVADGNYISDAAELIRYLPSHKLEKLSLTDNFIGPLNRTTFDRFTNLQNLKLRNTQISIADFNPFEQCHKLNEIDISYNNFERVNFTGMADNLHRLTHFYASHCRIRNVADVIRYLGDGIEELDVSGNYVNHLSTDLFASFTRLRVLNMSNTNIKHFAADTIQYLNCLVVFDLSANELRELDFGLMSHTIKQLYINQNDLQRVKNLNQHRFEAPLQVNIAGNCLSVNAVMEIVRNLSGSIFLTDPFEQNAKPVCNVYGQNRILAAISGSTIVIIIVYMCFVHRKNFIRKFKRLHMASNTAIEPYSNQKNTISTINTAELTPTSEPIYEELDDLAYVRYDQLWHEFNAKPLPAQIKNTYATVNNSNRCTI